MAINNSERQSIKGDALVVPIDSETTAIHLSGHWTQAASIQPVEKLLNTLTAMPARHAIQFRCEGLEKWDSRLPGYVFKIVLVCSDRNISVDTSALPEGVRELLKLAKAATERSSGASRKKTRASFLVATGDKVLAAINDSRELLKFVGEMILAVAAMLRGKARFRAVDMWLCIQDAGPAAFGIITLISLLVGLILAFVGAVQLAMFGAQIYIADLVGLGTVREMGALMTAVIVTGRTGAAYAAQLGTMNVNEEIDALKTMGISPVEFLVLPRMLSLILMMPLLCLYADLIGMLGGAMVTISIFDVSLIQYYNETCKAVHVSDFMIGLFKSLVFAVLIATAGCMRGLQCGRSASAVGDVTTAAVVNSIVYIVVADSVITLLCNRLDL